MNTKKQLANKTVAFRVPEALFDKFQQKCDENCRRMSEVLREAMRKYLKQTDSL